MHYFGLYMEQARNILVSKLLDNAKFGIWGRGGVWGGGGGDT